MVTKLPNSGNTFASSPILTGGLTKTEGNTTARSLDGNGSFRPCVVSAVCRFGLSRFGPGSFRPILVGRFGFSNINV